MGLVRVENVLLGECLLGVQMGVLGKMGVWVNEWLSGLLMGRGDCDWLVVIVNWVALCPGILLGLSCLGLAKDKMLLLLWVLLLLRMFLWVFWLLFHSFVVEKCKISAFLLSAFLISPKLEETNLQ